ASLVIATALPIAERNGRDATDASAAPVPQTAIRLTVNGVERRIEVEDRWTLVELLRHHLHLTGTRIGCGRGRGGALTVPLDGTPIDACSYLAAWVDGRSVQTSEGLAQNIQLHPLQQAFIEHDGPQCGFCTSGQLMSAKALLEINPHPSADDVRAALTGNICRCSNYNRYVEAVLAAAGSAPRQRKL